MVHVSEVNPYLIRGWPNVVRTISFVLLPKSRVARQTRISAEGISQQYWPEYRAKLGPNCSWGPRCFELLPLFAYYFSCFSFFWELLWDLRSRVNSKRQIHP